MKVKGWLDYDVKILAVKETFWEYDLMFMQNHGLLISEKLAETIKKSDLNGYSLEEANLNFYNPPEDASL